MVSDVVEKISLSLSIFFSLFNRIESGKKKSSEYIGIWGF